MCDTGSAFIHSLRSSERNPYGLRTGTCQGWLHTMTSKGHPRIAWIATMRKYQILVLFLLVVTAVEAFGASFYVRKGATGANNGTSWTNAWNEVSQINFSTVSCGDTIWLGGGVTYTTELVINKTCTSASPLTIQSVLAADAVPTTAAGYTSSLLGKVILLDQGVDIAAGAYITFGGRSGTPAGNNFGISIQCDNTAGKGGCNGIGGADAGNLSNITVSYVEVFGPPCVMTENCGGGGASGVNVAPSNNTVNALILDHDWIHQWGEGVRTSNWSNCIIQYTDIDTTHNDGQQHEDVIYNYAQTNFTMRFNRIWNSPNDGIFFDFGGTNGFYFYGNVYYHSGGEYIVFKGGYTNAVNIYMYNNVFEADGNGDYPNGWLDFTGASTTSGSVQDNVFENVNSNGGASGNPPNANYNAYSVSSYNDGGKNSFNYAPGLQFVNEPDAGSPLAANFHLTAVGAAAFAKGATESATYNLDPDGDARGTGGVWDIGAYEYMGMAPSPPVKLTGTVQ